MMQVKKNIDYYMIRLQELDKFNKAYDTNVDVYNCFKAYVLQKKMAKMQDHEQIWAEAFNHTHETLEAKLQYLYGVGKRLD